MSQITITKMTGNIGAEIGGIDLGNPLTTQQEDAIYDALIDHCVIFFRDQDLSPAAHLAFAQSFGEIDQPHPVYAHVKGYENIVKLANDAKNPPDTNEWHTDLTFKQNPAFASILVAREVPDVGGDTMWANMYAAYDGLDDHLKAYVETLSAIHDMGDFRNTFSVGESDGTRLMEGMARFGCALHDMVKTHPITGRKFLYVNESFTQHVVGLGARQSRVLLTLLLDHMNRPEYQVRFRWRNGSVAMWDNRCTQHYAVADYLPAYRCMNRITIVNDRRTNVQAG